ncbi:putative peptidylglycine alpha-hydroxylating monooxygenase 1 [Convolutriloba macropyga]|uniref:putative peptidylglycine alpha-hydroxylating monooxygenase 1 n=1 Tax=Convolutriloba macropyga TaxID=536237 RepID=UPI003F52183E
MTFETMTIIGILIMIFCCQLTVSKPAISSIFNSSITMLVDRHKDFEYLCRGERILGNIHLTAFESRGGSHKVTLYACERPAVTREYLVWECGQMTSKDQKPVCEPSSDQLLLYTAGGVRSPFHLPPDVAFDVGDGTKYQYLVLQVHIQDDDSATVSTDEPGVTYQYQLSPPKYQAGLMVLMSAGEVPPNAKVPVDENVLDIVCDPVSMPRNKTVYAFAYGVHSHSRGIWISGFRMRGLVNEEWTLIGSRNPQEEEEGRFRHIPTLAIHPQDFLISRCQYDNPTNDVILSGVGADHEMCYFYIMHYSERDGQTAPSSDEFKGFCIDFESIKINDLTSFLGEIPEWVQKQSLLRPHSEPKLITP